MEKEAFFSNFSVIYLCALDLQIHSRKEVAPVPSNVERESRDHLSESTPITQRDTGRSHDASSPGTSFGYSSTRSATTSLPTTPCVHLERGLQSRETIAGDIKSPQRSRMDVCPKLCQLSDKLKYADMRPSPTSKDTASASAADDFDRFNEKLQLAMPSLAFGKGASSASLLSTPAFSQLRDITKGEVQESSTITESTKTTEVTSGPSQSLRQRIFQDRNISTSLTTDRLSDLIEQASRLRTSRVSPAFYSTLKGFGSSRKGEA